MLPLLSPAPADAAVDAVTQRSHAWGSQANIIGDTVVSDPTAKVRLHATVGETGCTIPLTSDENSVASAGVEGLFQVDGISSDTHIYEDPSGAQGVFSHNHVANASLLGGEIAITGIDATADTAKQADGSFTADATSQVESLTILGETIEITGGKQNIFVAGLASIVLNNHRTNVGSDSASAISTAVRIRLLDGSDTVIRLGRAVANTDGKTIDGRLGGFGYGSTVTALDGTVISGQTARKGVPCNGSNGNTHTTSVATADAAGLATLENVVSTQTSDARPDAFVTTTNSIESTSVLEGLLELGAITSESHAESDGAGGRNKTSTATLASITLNGPGGPQDIPVPTAGGSVDIDGVGTLIFHREINPDGRPRVETIAVTIELLDVLGGATIELGRTRAVLHLL